MMSSVSYHTQYSYIENEPRQGNNEQMTLDITSQLENWKGSTEQFEEPVAYIGLLTTSNI